MEDKQKNHNIGMRGERETWPFLEKNGYIRPSKEQRKEIKDFYSKNRKEIKGKGFDVISKKEVSLIGKKPITLYEVKTAGLERGKKIGNKFKGFGFTLSINEKQNANILNDKYKFIFVNLYKETFKVYKLDDFFNNKDISSCYKTWSVFIKHDIK